MSSSISGIYEIVNKVNGNRYVGQSHDIQVRWRKHRQTLRHGTHDNRHLQSAWNKYGEDSFEFNVLCRCFPIKLVMDVMEQHYMDTLKPEYNLSPTAGGSCLGIVRSQETKDKLSKANKGRKLTPEHREKIKISANMYKHLGFTGKHTQEAKEKIAKARTGVPRSDETRRKISETKSGVKRGTGFSDETRKRMSEARVGKIMSEETKKKLSDAIKASWLNRRKQCPS